MPVDADRGRVRAVAEDQIIGGRQFAIHILEIARDGDFADGVSNLSILDPEPGRAARVIARDAIHANADQFRDVEAFAHIGHQFFGVSSPAAM